MLSNMIMNNEIIRIYKQIPKYGKRSILTLLQTVLDVSVVKMRVGVKWKEKVMKEQVPTKPNSHRKLKKNAKVFADDEE